MFHTFLAGGGTRKLQEEMTKIFKNNDLLPLPPKFFSSRKPANEDCPEISKEAKIGSKNIY